MDHGPDGAKAVSVLKRVRRLQAMTMGSPVDIEGRSLTSCEVSPDGETIKLGFLDARGIPTTLHLPLEKAGAVAMTLPALIEKAMRLRFGDDSLRYAYALGGWALERAGDPDTLMVTLGTVDGFGVCFSMRWEQGEALGKALSEPIAADILPVVH
jgi:hypothetical protein